MSNDNDDDDPFEDLGYGALPPEYDTADETPGKDRKREARHADPPQWTKPKVTETVPCMVPNCKNTVEVTDEGLFAFVVCSKQLAARGEQPLELGQFANCDECREERQNAWIDKCNARGAKITTSVRILKGLEKASYEEEREAMRFLEKVMGKGYLVELLRCIEAKKQAGSGKKARGDL